MACKFFPMSLVNQISFIYVLSTTGKLPTAIRGHQSLALVEVVLSLKLGKLLGVDYQMNGPSHSAVPMVTEGVRG